jgi:hypothetical protein
MTDILTCTIINKSIQAHLANGHIGLQCSDSGLAPARSFMVGISDLTPSDHYRMAQLPTWNAIEITVAEDTLTAAFARGEIRAYEQHLEMSSARLRTCYQARIGGTWIAVAVDSWLSRADRFLGYQRVTLSAERAVTVTIQVGIRENPEPERFPFRSLIWPHADYPRAYGQGFLDPRMSYAWRPGHMHVMRTTSTGEAAWAVAAVADGHGPAVGVALAVQAEGTRRTAGVNSRAQTAGWK